MLQNDPWADFEEVQPAPVAPVTAAPGPVTVGTVRPRLPTPQTEAQAALDQQQLINAQLEAEKKRQELEKKSGELTPEIVQQRTSAAQNVLTAIQNARSQTGRWTAGAGSILANLPGTDARDLRADIDTIKSNLAFDQLQQMRDNSPTGGAVGNVTEKELELLSSTVASLDQAQSPDQLKERLGQIEAKYADILQRMGYTAPAMGSAKGDVQFKDDQTGITGQRLTAEQQAEFTQLIRSPGITGADINNWLVANNLGPDPDIDAKVEQARKAGGFSEGVDYSKVDEAARERARKALEARDSGQIGGGQSDIKTLLETGMTLGLTDEAAGVGGALNSLVTGNPRNVIDAYLLNRDAERMRQEQARDNLGWGGTALEVGGGLLSANPRGVIAPVSSRLSTIMEGARGGATGGALAGYGYGDGLEGSATNALLGATAGGLVGGGISAIASRGRAYTPEVQQEAADIVSAAERQGIGVNAANVRPGTRNALAYLESSPGSAGPVQRNLGEQVSGLETRTAELASGTALSERSAGQVVRDASERFITRTGNIKNRMYDRATRAAGDTTVEATNAVAAIQAKIAQLSETPSTNQTRIAALQEILDDLAPGGTPKPISVQGMRDLRSGVRSSLKQKGLTMTPAEADAAEALAAVSQDISAALQQSNPEAARLFARADGFYQRRQTVINDVLKRVIGSKDNPLSGERVWQNVQNMARPKGDEARLATLMKTLEPEERLDLATTIAENLGRAKPGEDFSPAYFVSQTSQLSKRARQLFFGKDGAEAIEDLTKIARSTRDVQRSLNNSRSGQVMNYRQSVMNSLSTLVGAGGGAAAAGAPGAIAGAAVGRGAEMVARRVSAAVLLSPRFTKWLARAPKNATPEQIQAHIRRLGGIGRDTPLAADMQALQQSLQRQFAPAAADSGNDQEESK